jgi:hypothetical protein
MKLKAGLVLVIRNSHQRSIIIHSAEWESGSFVIGLTPSSHTRGIKNVIPHGKKREFDGAKRELDRRRSTAI